MKAMKKFISSLTLIFIVCNILGIAAFSEAASTITLSPAKGKPGEIVELFVSLSKDIDVANLQLEIEYDADCMTINKVDNLSTASGYYPAEKLDKNPYNFGWMVVSGNIFSEKLLSVKFLIADNATVGKYPVKISYYKGRDSNYTSDKSIFDKNKAPVYLNYLNSFITVTDDTTEAAPTEYSLCLDSQNVTLGGRLVAALYNNDGKLVESKFYSAEETVDISFSQKGDYIKLMQWNMDGLAPLTDLHRIELK